MESKNTISRYSKIKQSLKEAIFSKNKSIIAGTEFSKKNTFTKMATFTTINLFVAVPYTLWLLTAPKTMIFIPLLMASIALVLLTANSMFFVLYGLTRSLFLDAFKPKKVEEFKPLIVDYSVKEEVQAEYFEKGFMGRIKEFFVAFGSVAVTFLPFILLVNIILFSYLFQYSSTNSNQVAFFSNPLNYVKIDAFILMFLTTLATSGIYSVRGISHLRAAYLEYKSKRAEKRKLNAPPENVEAYQPKRNFQVEEFIPSLAKDFNLTSETSVIKDIYKEVNSSQETKSN